MNFSSIRSQAGAFLSAIFGIFIIFTVSLFIFSKPTIQDFPQKGSNVYWVCYVLGFILVSALIYLLITRIRHFTDLRINRFALMAIICVITIIPRAIWIYLVKVRPISDFSTFYNIAEGFTRGVVNAKEYISLFPHVIGYPAILALFYKAFGATVLTAQVTGIFFSCGIAILLYYIGRKMMNDICGIIAAVIWSLCPSQILYTSLVASEPVYVFFSLLCMLLFLHIIEAKRDKARSYMLFAILGVLCAVANAIRPFGLVFLIAIAIYYFIFVKENIVIYRPGCAKPILFVVLVISYFFVFQCLSITISKVIDRKVATSAIGFNTYVGSNIKYKGKWNLEDSKTLAELSKKPGFTAQKIHSELLKMGIQRYKTQGMDNFKLLIDKHKNMWLTENSLIWYIRSALYKPDPSKILYKKHSPTLSNVCNFYYYIMFVLCGVATYLMLKRKIYGFNIFLMLNVLGMMGVHMIVEASGRYHYPAISIFSLIIAFILVQHAGNEMQPKKQVQKKTDS